MTESGSDNLFSVLLESLKEFREQIEAEPGEAVASVGDSPDLIPEAIRQVLSGVDDSLGWLRTTVIALEQHVRAADATLAAIEVMTEVVGPAAEGLSLADLSENLGLSSGIATALDGPIEMGRQVFETAGQIGRLLPRPEDVALIKEELELLLKAPDPAQVGMPRSFRQLLSETGVATR